MTLSRVVTVLDTLSGEDVHERMIAGQLDFGGFVEFGGALYKIDEVDRLIVSGIWRWFLREVTEVGAA